jgi:hypothetical protein
MGIPLSSLSNKLGVNVAATDIFLVSNSDSTQDNKITRDELSKAFTGFYAQAGEGFTIFESNGVYGLSVSGSNGFVGINDRTPFVSLDVIDNTASTNGSGQIRLSTPNSGRKIGFSLSDPNTYYQFSKKPNDIKLYLESSVNNGSTFTNLFVVDQSGNFGITNSTEALSDKFLVSGASIQFQNSGNAILFDPYNTEIKTSANDETLFLNYNNIADINIGRNAVYVDNNLTAPKVGLGHSIPDTLLHVSGIGSVFKLQSSSVAVNQSFRNSTTFGNIGINSNKFYFGPNNGLSDSNIVYNMAGIGTLGIGNSNPIYKLDLVSSGPTDYTVAHFETTGAKTIEIGIGSNRPLDAGAGDTGPRNSFLTLSRYDGSSDVDKWSIGNIYNDSTFGGNDDFVFITNGYFGASPNVVAKLSKAGSLDIDGSYTTNDAYCKGKFVQVFKTRLTGNNIYFDPFSESSSASPSGHNEILCPFGITPYAGRIEKIQIISSDNLAAYQDGRFEIAAITQIPNTPSGVTGQTSFLPCSTNITTISGAIGYVDFPAISRNQLITLNRTQFTNTTAFASGQLLQYRICQNFDAANPGLTTAKNYTVMSTVSFTVT